MPIDSAATGIKSIYDTGNTSGKSKQDVLQASWDMLVVDEAIHLQCALLIPQQRRFISWFEKNWSGGRFSSVLLLTATPEKQLGMGQSFFAQYCRLLDPDRLITF